MSERWECIVVGGGAAGLSAALVLGRARRRTLVVDAGAQSNRAADGIGGLLGHDRRPPEELYRAGREELAAYPSVEVLDGRVVDGERRGDAFDLMLDGGSRETALAVLLATGMDYVPPDVPGLARRWGGSVFHCPFCHAWELRDRPLGVLDRTERATEKALLLSLWSDDLTLYTNGPLDVDVDRLNRAGVKIDDREVSELRGPGAALEAVAFTDGTERRCEGLLVPAPLQQRSALAARLGAAGPSDTGPLEADPLFRTKIPGLYVAGDAGAHAMPSVATAMAAGASAAKTIVHDLLARI